MMRKMNSGLYNDEVSVAGLTIYITETGGKYYKFNNGDHKYHISFPIEYALSHMPGTGPEECDNCTYYGNIGDDNVFLGYCGNCAQEYDYSRGLGLNCNGKEFPGYERVNYIHKDNDAIYEDNFIPFNTENVSQKSIYNTYLKHIRREELLEQFPKSSEDKPELIETQTFNLIEKDEDEDRGINEWNLPSENPSVRSEYSREKKIFRNYTPMFDIQSTVLDDWNEDTEDDKFNAIEKAIQMGNIGLR